MWWNMKYLVQNQGTVNLTDQNFLAEGGEGKIYTVGSTAYKIYTGTAPPIGKVTQLQALQHPAIISPQNLIFPTGKNTASNIAGYTMRFVPDTLALCRLFVTDFLNRNHLTNKHLTNIVTNMRDTFQYIHSKHMLVVDANENNFLIREGEWITPYFIDVLNWQTDTFPANAIMPNIQDPHTKNFNKNTDWYSFAILTCQLFTGIHPYKGNHPSYKRNDFLTRMKDNVSIFNSKVTLPSVVRDFSTIPPNLLEWYREVLEKGVRCEPPQAFDGPKPVVLRPTTQIITSQNFTIELSHTFDEILVKISQANAQTAFHTGKNTIYNKIKYPTGDIIFGINKNWWLSSDSKNITLTSIDGKDQTNITINHNKVLVVDNTIYVIGDNHIHQLAIYENTQSKLMFKQTWNLLPGRTNIYDNMLIVNALGQKVFMLLDSRRITTTLIRELQVGRIIDAKYDNHVAVVITENNGGLTKRIIRWNSDFSQYVIWDFDNITTPDINFVVMDNGIAVSIEEDSRMIIFNNNPSVSQIKDITDKQILTKMRLTKYNSRIHFIVNERLYSISMK
jgi:hypothetical protein